MNHKFKKGTPAFGVLTGAILALLGYLVMRIGFWKPLLLAALFCVGYFLGAVGDKEKYVRDTMNRVIPEKKTQTIHVREELSREQAEQYAGSGVKQSETNRED